MVNYAYDAAGRLTAKTFPATPAENVTYTYDDISGGNFGKGRLTSVSDQSGSTAFTYDAFGQVVQEVRTIGTYAHIVGYAYDDAGRLASITYPSGRSVTYGRDGQGRITSVTTRKDALSPLEDVAANIAWQPFGPLRSP